MCKEYLTKLATKYFPFDEQVCRWRCFPTERESMLAPAILFWGVRCEPCTVRAVRCACCGVASGANFMGMLRVVSIVLRGWGRNALLNPYVFVVCPVLAYGARHVVRMGYVDGMMRELNPVVGLRKKCLSFVGATISRPSLSWGA